MFFGQTTLIFFVRSHNAFLTKSVRTDVQERLTAKSPSYMIYEHHWSITLPYHMFC